MTDRLRALTFRLYGQPPPEGARQSERLRYVRRFYTRPLWLTALKVLLIAYIVVEFHHNWIVVLFVVITLMGILGYASLTLQIRRAERREISAYAENDHV